MDKIKKLLKLIALIVLIALVSALPLAGLYLYAINLPAVYKESYYAALPLKYDRLKGVSEPKVVVIGGSSVAFGIDSKLMEQELGRPCVNFGLYAAFGLKPMLDLAEGAIGEDDIVVLAPELSSQMFSGYVGYEYLLEAMEKHPEMAFALGTDYAKGFLAGFFDYCKNSKKILANGEIKYSGVYALASFDSYGDIVYQRDNNIMDDAYSGDNLPELTADIVTEDFSHMINSFVTKVRKKGAQVYWSFCPINELSVDADEKAVEVFTDSLEEKLDCEIIGSLSDHIMAAGYFYDSNFHTNDAGTVYNTVLLINDLKRVFGRMTDTHVAIPTPVVLAGSDAIDSGETEHFTYKVTTGGIIVTGLTRSGLEAENIEVPEVIDNLRVTAIGEGAFENAAAVTITLPATVSTLSRGIFAHADRLKQVYLNAAKLPAVGDSLMENAGAEVVIYVPGDMYGNYVTDYFWGRYEKWIMSK